MLSDDIESAARTFERAARNYVHAAAHERDQAVYHRSVADLCERRAAQDMGNAHGFAFRAAELRYDARGGMTAATERRRLEPGARWTIGGEGCAVACNDTSGLRVDSDRWTDGFYVRAAEITRANGWRFLGLPGEYR